MFRQFCVTYTSTTILVGIKTVNPFSTFINALYGCGFFNFLEDEEFVRT